MVCQSSTQKVGRRSGLGLGLRSSRRTAAQYVGTGLALIRCCLTSNIKCRMPVTRMCVHVYVAKERTLFRRVASRTTAVVIINNWTVHQMLPQYHHPLPFPAPFLSRRMPVRMRTARGHLGLQSAYLATHLGNHHRSASYLPCILISQRSLTWSAEAN